MNLSDLKNRIDGLVKSAKEADDFVRRNQRKAMDEGARKLRELPQQFGVVADWVRENNAPTPTLNSPVYRVAEKTIPFQQLRFTQETVKPFAQATYNNIIPQGIGNVGVGIADRNPIKIVEGAGRMGLGALSLYGVGKLTPGTLAVTGVLGAGIGGGMAAYNGTDISEGASSGFYGALSRASSIAGVGSITNPIQTALTQNVGAIANNPIVARIVQGLTGAGLSVPEGYLMNKAAGKETYDKTDLAFDIGAGFLLPAMQRPISAAEKEQFRQGLQAIGAEGGFVGKSDSAYQGGHKAPVNDGYSAPAYDLTGGGSIYPADIYTDPKAFQYYGDLSSMDAVRMSQKSLDTLRKLKSNPDAEITIYRAVPKNIKDGDINPGDWVTINKDYAIDHGRRQFNGGKILTKTVKAKEIFTDGNSIHEFGYDPNPLRNTGEGGFIRLGDKKIPTELKDFAPDSRPRHQADIEELINAGDVKGAQQIVKDLPPSDQYKQSMENLLSAMQQTRKYTRMSEGIYRRVDDVQVQSAKPKSGIIRNPNIQIAKDAPQVQVAPPKAITMPGSNVAIAEQSIIEQAMRDNNYDEVVTRLAKIDDSDPYKQTVQKLMLALGKDKLVSDNITAVMRPQRQKLRTMNIEEIQDRLSKAMKDNDPENIAIWTAAKEQATKAGGRLQVPEGVGETQMAATINRNSDMMPSPTAIANSQPKPKPEWMQDLEFASGEGGFLRLGDSAPPKQKNIKIADPSAPKIVDQEFRTDKFSVSRAQEKTLKAIQKTLGLDTRDVRSFDEMTKMAGELGTDPRRLLKDIETGRITDKEIIALGQQINNSSNRINTLSKQLREDPNNAKIMAQLDAEETIINQAIKKRLQGGTEAGRAVVAFKLIAKNTLDPVYWLNKAQRQVGMDKQLKTDEITAIQDLIKQKDTVGLATYINGLGESNLREKITALWKAGLLTGLRTHEANIISNTAMGALETAKDIPATVFDIVRSGITGGQRTKAFGLNEITSQPSGALRGLKQAKDYLQTGVDPRDLEKAELPQKLRFGETWGGRIAQKFTDGVFGALGAEDKIFREAAFNRSLSEQLNVARINGGLNEDQLKELAANPPQDMLNRALGDALQATFNKDNKLADAVRAAKRNGGEGVAAAIDVTAPFVRTPTNVAEAMLDYSPAGFMKDVIKKVFNAKSVDDRRLAESFGRSTVGSTIIALGYMLAQNGMINGASSSSEAQRSQDNLERSPANSVMIGGQWRKLDRISPLGNLLILGAEAYKNGGDVTATIAGGARSLSEQSFLKGLSGALAGLADPERQAGKWLENLATSFVPTIVSDIARANDTTVRDTQDGLLSKIQNRIPGARNDLPERLDPLGQPMKERSGLQAIIDPFNSTEPSKDPLVNEFKRVGYNLNYVDNQLGGEKLPGNIQREYQKRAGQYIREMTPTIIDSNTYKGKNTDEQRDLIEKVVNKAKSKAREEIKSEIKSGKLQGAGLIPTASAEEDTQSTATYADAVDSGAKFDGLDTGLQDVDYEEDGQFKTLNLSKIPQIPEMTGEETVDKKLRSKFYGELTAYGNRIVKAVELKRLDAKTASIILDRIDSIKSKSGGGRKPKAITVKTSNPQSLPKITISNQKRNLRMPKLDKGISITRAKQSSVPQRLFTIKA